MIKYLNIQIDQDKKKIPTVVIYKKKLIGNKIL